MKRQLCLLLLLAAAMVSCRKFTAHEQGTYLGNVKAGLKDSVSSGVFSGLDFDHSVISEVDSLHLYVLRIPFQGKKLENDFVAVLTDLTGNVQMGRIIHMEGGDVPAGDGRVKKESFAGFISINYLSGKQIVHSKITDGYIEAFHEQYFTTRTETLMAPDVLPEVVVVAFVSSGVSYADWMLLQSYFYTSGGFNSTTGYYSPVSNGGGNGGPGTSYSTNNTANSSGGSTSQAPVVQMDAETYVSHPAIDIAKYVKCFDNIPDAGSTCSIEIFSDIPVDSDPKKLFDISSQFPGHTFIQIKKTNGSQSVSQNIGFYPRTNWQSIITTAPVDGKFVDDAGHEFNASLKMNVTPDNFHSILTEILYLSHFIRYDVDEYNCTDFAMDVFNAVRSNKLQIPMYDLPGGITAAGSRTPQGLYIKLKQMKDNNDPEAPNITLPGVKGWVGSSNGPCN